MNTSNGTDRLIEIRDRLIEKTAECRVDMHEPDEQGVYASVTGTHLDNAFGSDPFNNQCEFSVGLHDGYGNETVWFNLADLIALARLAQVPKP